MNNQKKILILGATGMAGHVMTLYLESLHKYQIINSVYRNKLNENSIILDLNNKFMVEQMITEVKPDIIINCVGVLVKGSLKNPSNAVYLNAYLPHQLSDIARKINAKLIHISTDCVFSGKKGNYSEDDFRDADDIYGRSKALGEIINEKDLTIRTSIIGPEIKKNGEGLFHWFMNKEGIIKGFSKAIWGGVTTLELAKFVDYAIDKNYNNLIHLSNGKGISKFDLLNLFKEIWKKNIIIEKYDKFIIDKSIAKSDRTEYKVPSYREMLLNQLKWINSHSAFYNTIY